jgi:hypothetical protein
MPCAAPREPSPVCNRTEAGNPDDVPEMPEGFVAYKKRKE